MYRVLVPGGPFRGEHRQPRPQPYIPLHARFYRVHMAAGFLPMGGSSGEARAPAQLRVGSGERQGAAPARHPRYLLVFAKGLRDPTGRVGHRARRVHGRHALDLGHPARVGETRPARRPSRSSLAGAMVHLYSYTGDVVLDPCRFRHDQVLAAASQPSLGRLRNRSSIARGATLAWLP